MTERKPRTICSLCVHYIDRDFKNGQPPRCDATGRAVREERKRVICEDRRLKFTECGAEAKLFKERLN